MKRWCRAGDYKVKRTTALAIEGGASRRARDRLAGASSPKHRPATAAMGAGRAKVRGVLGAHPTPVPLPPAVNFGGSRPRLGGARRRFGAWGRDRVNRSEAVWSVARLRKPAAFAWVSTGHERNSPSGARWRWWHNRGSVSAWRGRADYPGRTPLTPPLTPACGMAAKLTLPASAPLSIRAGTTMASLPTSSTW